jgi:hypothetical protein
VSPTCRRERQEGEAKGLYRIFVQASSLFTSPPLMVIFSMLSYRPVTLFSLRSTLLSAIISVAMATLCAQRNPRSRHRSEPM